MVTGAHFPSGQAFTDASDVFTLRPLAVAYNRFRAKQFTRLASVMATGAFLPSWQAFTHASKVSTSRPLAVAYNGQVTGTVLPNR